MKKFDLRILWGGLLILVGGLFFMQELDLVPNVWGFIWSLLFGIAGCVFLYAFWLDRTHWWPLIPGLGLLSLGVLLAIDEFLPGVSWTGAIFLGGIGVSFWLIYLTNREQWWAVIPGGVLLTLSLVAGLDPILSGDAGGGIFMLGLGFTFCLVGLIPTPQGKMRWAFIPAVVLLLIGTFLISSLLPLWNVIWPVALIILGVYFILRNFLSRSM
jgi:hypothetical protein